MASIGDTNFSLKPDVNMAAIASLYQKKATDEQTMREQQSQIESQQQDRVMNVMKMATDMTQSLIQGAAHSQMIAGRNNLMSLMGQSANTVETPPTPGIEGPGLPTQFGSTPDFKAKVRQAAIQANPEAATKEIAQSAFAPEAGKDQQIVQTVKPDGSVGYVLVNKANNTSKEVPGLVSPGITPEQRNQQIATRQEIADALKGRTELSSIQSGPGAVEQGKIQQARHLDQLLYQTYNRKTGTFEVKPFQYTELSLGLARLVNPQSVVAQQLENKIEQPTTKGDLARIYVRITGDTSTDLSNASTQDLLNLYAHAIQRQGETAEDNRNDAYAQAQQALGKKADSKGLMSYRDYNAKVKKLAGYADQGEGVPEVGGTYNGSKVLKVTRIK